ncbi:MAG: hypothetical protein WCJ64_19780 [Rhodospirillaceae bacterium]
MSVQALHGTASAQSFQPVQQARVQDKDHDGDNDATESAAAKAQEAAKTSKPVSPHLGNAVNVTA